MPRTVSATSRMKVLVRFVSVQNVQNERVAVPEKYGCAHLAPVDSAPSRRLAASALTDLDVAAILAPHLHSPASAAAADDGAAPARRLTSASDVDATVADAGEAPAGGARVAAARAAAAAHAGAGDAGTRWTRWLWRVRERLRQRWQGTPRNVSSTLCAFLYACLQAIVSCPRLPVILRRALVATVSGTTRWLRRPRERVWHCWRRPDVHRRRAQPAAKLQHRHLCDCSCVQEGKSYRDAWYQCTVSTYGLGEVALQVRPQPRAPQSRAQRKYFVITSYHSRDLDF